MRGSLYTLAFAALLGSACALVLTGVGEFTAPYRKANANADEVRNILGVLRVPYEPHLAFEGLAKVFARNVETADRGGLRLYLFKQDGGAIEAVAVPFSGTGLWGPIEGFLALEPDMATIRGITFYRQEETPGLGGEIAAGRFTRRFEGKSIVDASGSAGLRILRGGGNVRNTDVHSNGTYEPQEPVGPRGRRSPRTVAGKPGLSKRDNQVDGITGATMTCERVQAMLNEVIAEVAKARDAVAR